MTAQPVLIGSTKALKVGSRVYAIGTPEGLDRTLSEGIISGLRPVEGGHYLQITAPISPGSSGGGLFDEEGRLIGLTSFYMAEGQQLNFAVPVEWVDGLRTRHEEASGAAETYVEWLIKAKELEKKKDWIGLIDHSILRTKSRPNNPYTWYNLGWAYDAANQFDNAIEAYRSATSIDPELIEAWNNLGLDYAHLSVEYHQPDGLAKAIEAHRQALRINPEYLEAWNNLGMDYTLARQFDKAIETCQHMLRLNPEYANAWYLLCIVYTKTGQRGEAMDAYAHLKTIDPAKADLFMNKFVLP